MSPTRMWLTVLSEWSALRADKEPRSGCGRHSPAVGKEDGVLHPLEVLFTGDSSLLGFLAVFPSPLRTQVAPSYK